MDSVEDLQYKLINARWLESVEKLLVNFADFAKWCLNKGTEG